MSSFSSVISWQIRFLSSQVFGPCQWAVLLAESWTKLSVRLALWATGGSAVLSSGAQPFQRSVNPQHRAFTHKHTWACATPTQEMRDEIKPGHGRLFPNKVFFRETAAFSVPFMHMCMHLSSNTHTVTHIHTHPPSCLLQMGTAKALTHGWLSSIYGFHTLVIMYCSQYVIASI